MSPMEPQARLDAVRKALETNTGHGSAGWTVQKVSQNRGKDGGRLVFRATHPELSGPLAVKWCGNPGQNHSEWEGLHSLGGDAHRLVAPVFIDTAGHVMATKWMDAPRLDAVLRDAPEDGRHAPLRRAGEWLGALHGSNLRKLVWRDFTSVPDQLARRFPEADAPEIKYVLAEFDRRARKLGRIETDAVPLHWDYRPHNLFVTDEGPVAFDVCAPRYGLAIHDVACFLVEMELNRYEAEFLGNPCSGVLTGTGTIFFGATGPYSPRLRRYWI